MNFSPDVLALNPGIGLAQNAQTIRVKTRPMPGPKFKSHLEARAWREWMPQQGAVLALYEPLLLKMNGGNYTPDFVLLMPSTELWLIEVKRSWKAHPSGRSSKRNLQQAAVEFAWLGRFFSLLPEGRQDWNFTEITS